VPVLDWLCPYYRRDSDLKGDERKQLLVLERKIMVFFKYDGCNPIDYDTGAFAPIPGDADIGGVGVGLRLPKMRE
jgi:hypothetical protein